MSEQLMIAVGLLGFVVMGIIAGLLKGKDEGER